MNDEERKLLLDFLLGNQEAANFCEDILYAAHLWDDQIDRDKERTDAEINQGWVKALVSIPRNAFYRQHFDLLSPVIITAIGSWMTATQYEREAGACQDKLNVAFVIRSDYLNVLVMCANIIGGLHYGASMAPALREVFHKEGLKDYRNRLRKEPSDV
jgi:hypothetical protein